MVEWEDYHTIEGWHAIDGPLNDEAVVCRSVGWRVLDGENVKTVAPHMTPADADEVPQACGIKRIPARSILRIVELAWPAEVEPPTPTSSE